MTVGPRFIMSFRSMTVWIWIATALTAFALYHELGLSDSTLVAAGEGESVQKAAGQPSESVSVAGPIERAVQDRLKEIEKRESALSSRETELAEREKALRDQISRFDTESKRLEKLNLEMEKRIVDSDNKSHANEARAEAKAAREESEKQNQALANQTKNRLIAEHQNRVVQLRDVYEKMDPKRAGKILDEMNVDLATEIVRGMKRERAADILARMSTEKARKISEKIGERTSKVSVNDVQLMESKGGE